MDPNAETHRLVLAVSPRHVLLIGLPASVALAATSLLGRALWYDGEGVGAFVSRVMDVDHEGSVPAFLSAAVLLACAASLWTVGDGLSSADRRQRWAWRLLALAFVYLALDEVVALHEEAIDPVRAALDLDGVFYYAWVVVALPLLVLLAVVLLPLLRSLPRWTLLAFLLSGAVYVGGALGMEMVGGAIASDGGGGSLRLHTVVTVEELFEMVGMTLFLAAVNEHRRRHVGTVRLDPPVPSGTATTEPDAPPAPATGGARATNAG